MKFSKYVKSKKIIILLQVLFNLLFIYYCLLMDVKIQMILYILFIIDAMSIIYFLYYYNQLRKIILNLEQTEQKLEQKFLIKEVQTTLNYEEELIFKVIENISKSQYQELKILQNKLEQEKTHKLLWVHEIKQPLAILNADQIPEYTRKKAVNRINNNLNLILKAEKINEMGNDLQYQQLSVLDSVNSALKKFSYELVEINPKIDIKIASDHTILTDVFWWQFILEQLISNAIKYRSQEQLRLTFKTMIVDKKLIFKLSDNGVGIDEYDLKNIYEKGYRGNNSKKLAKASGFGLFYVDQVIEKLNANICIKNNNSLGVTATITFTLAHNGN